MSPAVLDGVHLHMLVFRRIMRWTVGSQVAAHIMLRNSMTSPYLWLLCALVVFPATLWWRSTWAMLGFTLFFLFNVSLVVRKHCALQSAKMAYF